jgi:transposase
MTLDVRELVRRLRAGETDRAIARDLGIARKTVAKYRQLAKDEELLGGALLEAGALDRLLQKSLPPPTLPRQEFKAAPFEALIRGWREQGVESRAIFERLRDEKQFTGSYSAVHRYIHFLEGDPREAFVRIEVEPGEEAQVDFGYAGWMTDPKTRKLRKAWAFVMTLSHSRHQYATFVFDQSIATWLRCHREAFEFLGGVPRRIVLDNLKAAIVKAVLHEPVAQRSYRECAEHYGFLISPCRPRTPRHKGKVESGVRYLKRNFLAGRTFADLAAANAELLGWIERVAGRRMHGTTKQRPLDRFVAVEKAALLALPSAPYDLGVWKKVKLHPDCHVVVDHAFYSAPHRLIGQQLWVRSNGREVVIFHDYLRIATHAWGTPGTRRTMRDHLPPDKVAVLMATPQYCRERAQAIGPCAAELVGQLLDERPLDRLRTVQAMLRLADRYGHGRFESAARRALCYGDTRYATVKRILERGLDADPLPTEEPSPRVLPLFAFARTGSEIFPVKKGTDHGTQLAVDPEAQGVAAVGDLGHPRHA